MKKVVRFVEQVTVKQTVVVEQIGNSHSESNFINHVCHRREDKYDATIELDPTNELLPHYLPVFPTVDECYEDEDPTAIHHLSVLPTVESTTYHTLLSPATGSNRRYRSCRWRINKKDMDDMTPILPLRQDSISKELFIPDQHPDVLRPSNAYNWKKNHDSISKQLFIPDQHQDVLPPSKAYSISKELFIPDQHHVVLPPSNAYNGKTNRAA